MSFVVQVRQRARGNVSAAMVVWSLAMTVVLAAGEISPASDGRAALWGLAATAVFGAYLGWRRRGAAVFVAPMVSWSFAWLPLWIAAMVRHGFFKGLFVGLFLITVGWLVIGTLEFLSLGAVTLLVRSVRGGGPGAGDDEVVIFGPDDRR
jgi:hypothetical protein